MGDCQNYGPFLGPYYNTGPHTGPNLGDPKRDHNFDNPPNLGPARGSFIFTGCHFHDEQLGKTQTWCVNPVLKHSPGLDEDMSKSLNS